MQDVEYQLDGGLQRLGATSSAFLGVGVFEHLSLGIRVELRILN